MSRVVRWLPTVAIMSAIFAVSSIPSNRLPQFGVLDLLIKKGGHMLAYGLLSLACWYGLQFEKRGWWLSLLLVGLYAVTDEFHQSFVPGRHPSWLDVGIDLVGASIVLGVLYSWRSRRTADRIG